VKTFVFLLILAWVAWVVFVQVQARKQSRIATSLGKIAVQDVIDRTFGSTWSRVAGPGHVNVRQKLRSRGPTISIDVEPGSGSGSEVDIWMSSSSTRYGMVNHGQLVWRKKRALASALTSVGSTTVGGSMQATSSPGSSSTPVQSPRTPHSLGDDGSSQGVLRLLEESSTSFVIRSGKSPLEAIQAIRTALPSTQAASATHFMVGPPRATLWGHVEALPTGGSLIALSLVTQENADFATLRESLQCPLEASVAPDLGGNMDVLSGGVVPGRLADEVLKGRVVPVSELGF
jgi:hypothetical protein